eukprot:GHVR01013803.1.p1 GENE.GHVR01013803.1~~GHVR01013803.1.p1  ORF type:complete len:303 (-),score=65.39 GHVR01013803.1:65-928(-)
MSEEKDVTLDKYKKLSVLGKGSFGKAYLVEKSDSNELCVVKQMETSAMSKKEKDDCIKEAQVLRCMNHPNIVQFHEVFMSKRGRLCIVMDFVDGGDLYGFISNRQGVPVPQEQVLTMFTQMALALNHVHNQKVLHRDLKTKNIFLTTQGDIKLGDFGIAKVFESTMDMAQTMVGTPYYISPEIVAERPYSYKSDVWSLGVILYELCTLTHPFEAESLHELAVKIIKHDYAPLDQQLYGKAVSDLVSRLLTKDEKKRPTLTDILDHPVLAPYLQEWNETFGNKQSPPQ